MTNKCPVPGRRLSVAPMMEWTNRHGRFFLRQLSRQAWLYSEMLTAEAILHGVRPRLLDFDPAEHPLALQLGGSEPQRLAAAAVIGAEWGYDEINLNCGCPSDRVQAGKFGASLMREPDLIADCVRAMRQNTPDSVPITVKTRIGVNDQEGAAFLDEMIRRLVDAGCDAVILHARPAWLKGISPKQNREKPPLDYASVHALKQRFPDVPIIINGDINTVELAREQLKHVDGVMIGRAAYRTPWLLQQIAVAMLGETPLPNRATTLEAIMPYIDAQMKNGVPFKSIARHLLGLYHGCRGGRAYRRCLSQAMRDEQAGSHSLQAALAMIEAEDG